MEATYEYAELVPALDAAGAALRHAEAVAAYLVRTEQDPMLSAVAGVALASMKQARGAMMLGRHEERG